MKKLALAVTVLLMGLGAGLTSCGSGDKSDSAADTAKAVSGTKQGEAFATTINIRYVDMDSLLKHYDFAVEQSAKAQQIALELQQYQNQLARNLQSKQAAIQQKVQNNGYLSEASYNADMTELQKLDQASQAQYARRAQADEQRILELNESVTKAIQDYVVEYNKKYKYDAILHKEVGLYFNPALDITGELVQCLNAEYKAKSGKKEESKSEEKK